MYIIEGFMDYTFEGIDMMIDIYIYCGIYVTLNILKTGYPDFKTLMYMYNTVETFNMQYDLILPSLKLYNKYAKSNKDDFNKEIYALASLSIAMCYYNDNDCVTLKNYKHLCRIYNRDKFITAQVDLLKIY